MGLTRPRAHQLQDSDFKQSVRAIQTSNITLGGGAPSTVDGVSVSIGDRILVTGQSTASQNGIYVVTTVGSGSNGTWARSADADTTGDMTAGMVVMVTEGTNNADTSWKITTDDPITLDTTNITFEQSSAYGYGTISVAGQDNIVADQVGDTLTVAAGNNIALTTTAGTDTLTVAVSDSINTSGTITATGNITGGNLVVTGEISYGTLNDGTTALTSTVAELNILDGVTATATELNLLDGVTASTTELNLLDGVTGITLGNANELLVVGSDGTSIVTDSVLTIDADSNYIGINQTSPEVTLHMTGEAAQSAQIRMEQMADTSDAPDIRTRKSRGTAAAPTKNSAGDFIYRQNHERYNGTGWTTVGQLAVDTNSSNADRFQLTLTVSEDGSNIDAAEAQFKIDGNDSGAITFNDAYKFPTSDGTANQVLTTDGSGSLTFADIPSGDIVDDTTPQLGGDLDLNSNDITGTGNVNITGTGTFTTMTDGTVSFTAGNISGVDELRIDQNGTGLRMTNVGAFDNDGSDNFRIFATNDLKISANGQDGTAITIDATNQDVTVTNDLRVAAGNIFYGGTAITSTATELNLLDGVTGTLVTEAGTQTLTNKSISGSQINSGTIPDARIQSSGVTQHQASLSITESQISDLGSYITASSTDTLTNKSISASQVNSGTLANAQISSGSVVQHQGDLTITESQISDLGSYITASSTDTLTNKSIAATQLTGTIADARIASSSITQHEGDLTITESQISDLQSYLTSETVTSISLATNTLSYTDENGSTTNLDLSLYLDDTNLARITAGTVAANGVATFSRDDASTFTVDFSPLLDDTNLTRITSASFNTTNGVLTLTRSDATTVTVDLDGRFLTDYTVTSGDVTAHQASLSITESQISDLGSYITASSTDTLTNKSISGSQINSGTIPDARIQSSGVTQHQADLSITESQISDLGSYITASSTDTLTNKTLTSPQVTTDLRLNARAELEFYDTDSSHYVAFRGAATIGSNIIWTLPSSDGTADQVLATDGGGTLSWADPGSGGGSGSSFPNSTIQTLPGSDGNYDLSKTPAQGDSETPFESGVTDAFGINLGSVFDASDPIGSIQTAAEGEGGSDLGVLT